MRKLNLVVGLPALIAVVGWAHHSSGQPACDTSCPIRMRDARGCCPRSAVPSPGTLVPAPPAAPAAPTAPRNDKTCPAGQEASQDTAGQCCWPGQAWSGSRCVGLPSRCPESQVVNAEKQICTLVDCAPGKVRAADGTHCCWPEQAWTSRGVCVGVPKCPPEFEPQGEQCVSSDRDGDKIPNTADKCPDAAEDLDGYEDEDGCPDLDHDADGIPEGIDKCPAEAEDRNSYRDDDGCPDEPERLKQAAAARRATQAQQEADKAAAEKLAREQAVQEALAQQQAESLEREGGRTTGWALTIVGAAGWVLSGAMFGLGASNNSSIANGDAETAADIESMADNATTLNVVAVAAAIGGGVLLAVGIPYVALNQDPDPEPQPTVGLVVTPDSFRLDWGTSF